MTEPLCLFVSVPVCAFRPYASREYQDTYPVPTPASVYGMLLSYLGVRREDKGRHRGVQLALAVERLPPRSRVFRKLRRGELNKKNHPHLSDDERVLLGRRPDYQDVLTDLRLWVWVRPGADPAEPCLATRLRTALADPTTIKSREGGLSLGESSYLVDELTARLVPPAALHFVTPDPAGFYSLPVWVDHTDAANTRLQRFRVGDEAEAVEAMLPTAWFAIPND